MTIKKGDTIYRKASGEPEPIGVCWDTKDNPCDCGIQGCGRPRPAETRECKWCRASFYPEFPEQAHCDLTCAAYAGDILPTEEN